MYANEPYQDTDTELPYVVLSAFDCTCFIPTFILYSQPKSRLTVHVGVNTDPDPLYISVLKRSSFYLPFYEAKFLAEFLFLNISINIFNLT
jgi:hypothetical protein